MNRQNNPQQEIERIYAGSEVSESPLGQIRTINRRAILKYLCSHYMKHLFSGSASLNGLLDIALLLRQDREWWEEEETSPWQIESNLESDIVNGNVLYPPLLLASRWLGAPVSDTALKGIEQTASRWIRRRAQTEASTFGAAIFGGQLYRFLPSYQLWSSYSQKCQNVITAVFPSAEKLEKRGFLAQGTNPIAGYIQYYNHMWRDHFKPTLGFCFRRRQFPIL